MIKKTILISLFTLFITSLGAQQLFYQDVVYGGVTGGGFSTGSFSQDVSNKYIVLSIPAGTNIKKAYLFFNSWGTPAPLRFTFNSHTYNLDSVDRVGEFFLTPNTSNTLGALHAVDVSREISVSSDTNYISYPLQPSTSFSFNNSYGAFYLLVVYEDLSMSKTGVSVYLNEKDALHTVSYQLDSLNPIDTTRPIGLAMHSDIIWDTITDGTFVFVNGDSIGLIGGSDSINKLYTGAGVKGHFYYQNDSLFGLDDDTPDSLMSGTDGLADIKTYVPNLSTSVNLDFIMQPTAVYNIYLSFILSYSTPCDTFSTQAMPLQDTICYGDSVLLQATGGSQYSWYGAFGGLSNPHIANPMASPSQTSTYICTITNDSGCVKTEHVKIWVNPLPKADTVRVTATSCGDSTGTLQVGSIANGSPPYTYTLSGVGSSYNEVQFIPNFTTLATGSYHLTIQDAKGCQWDTILQILEINLTQVQFTANPMEGVKPLTVNFTNTSIGTTHYKWYVNGDSVSNTLDYVYTFNQSGTYLVSLVGYNNFSHCSDTFSIQLEVKDSLLVYIPQFISPNGDGKNDAWQVQIGGAKQVDVKMFNRWGSLVYTHQNPLTGGLQNHELWNGLTQKGKPVVSGTYFYVLVFTDNHGQTHPYTGFLEVRR